ncbi:M23 family metallopeptidase, partial [bacterium]|nr:M23 family metallopeptidase [bacterium]
MAHFNCSELLRKCKNSLLERIPQKVLASVAVIFLLAATLLAKDAPPWPLKIEISPSSSFGEFRGMRFHTGVDLRTKTNQKTGYPVYAIEDGFVSRMKVQHRGFGYALYVDHPSINSRAVFGHLEDYAEPMATYIREKLKKMRAHFGIDDFFQESKFPIKKGQIIAYTGESGLGPPHLHFELRKFNDELIAPTSLGMIIPDKRPPDLLDIYFEPLATDSRINDQFLP